MYVQSIDLCTSIIILLFNNIFITKEVLEQQVQSANSLFLETSAAQQRCIIFFFVIELLSEMFSDPVEQEERSAGVRCEVRVSVHHGQHLPASERSLHLSGNIPTLALTDDRQLRGCLSHWSSLCGRLNGPLCSLNLKDSSG